MWIIMRLTRQPWLKAPDLRNAVHVGHSTAAADGRHIFAQVGSRRARRQSGARQRRAPLMVKTD